MFELNHWLYQNPLIVALIVVSVAVLSVVMKKKGNTVLLVCYVLFILYMTLMTRSIGMNRARLELFWSYKVFFTSPKLRLEIIDNIWLFLPLGTIICSLCPKWFMVAVPVALSMLIEAAQYFTGLGLAEYDDVISNSIGALLGFAFALTVNFLCKVPLNKS